LEAYETPEQREWLARQFDALTSELVVLKPSEWAEQHRYLPPSVTPLPGYYSFEVAPYLREILDCLAPSSPVREVTFMKGVQICATVGILENAIGYYIAHVQTAPMMLITADSELAKLRMESYITPMLQFSGLEHLIKSADEKNTRKKGKTDRKIEWFGGGFLIPVGAQNANKLRSTSIEVVLRDEVDGWPDNVGKDGDPLTLSADRAAAFEGSRKIADISTPLLKGQSKIDKRFQRGDQRRYFVRCLKCSFPQVLRWRVEKPGTGEIAGIVWELEKGNLIPDSVRYLCAECGHPHTNEDKARLLSPDHGAEWKPTAVPADPFHRSYHLSALYSPPTMQTWGAHVLKWLEAWDVERNRMKDPAKLQVFYNNVLGEPYEQRSERVRMDAVSPHKRSEYHFGQVPNKFCERHCGGPVLLLTCTVDVQADNLAVAVFGWCRDRRAILIDYWRFEGNTEQLDDPGTWRRLDELITEKVYVADDGKQYRIGAKSLTLIDSGYRTDQVYNYCDSFQGGVYPVKGREKPPIALLRDFSEFKTPTGLVGYLLTVDNYKDRWSAALRREWDGIGLQPVGHFNAPHDIKDAQLKELTVELKRPRAARSNGQESGFEWHRTPGAPNELWDLLVYANAALELVCYDYCRNAARLDYMNWPMFWDHCLEQKIYFT
jgi:phage terminase large subunit GpA-like protein